MSIRETMIDLINAQCGAQGDAPIELLSLDEAIQAIINLILEKIPKEKEMPDHFDLCLLSNEDRSEEEGKINGYNQALTEMRERIKEV